jgi:hypothetical protein
VLDYKLYCDKQYSRLPLLYKMKEKEMQERHPNKWHFIYSGPKQCSISWTILETFLQLFHVKNMFLQETPWGMVTFFEKWSFPGHSSPAPKNGTDKETKKHKKPKNKGNKKVVSFTT